MVCVHFTTIIMESKNKSILLSWTQQHIIIPYIVGTRDSFDEYIWKSSDSSSLTYATTYDKMEQVRLLSRIKPCIAISDIYEECAIRISHQGQLLKALEKNCEINNWNK